MELTGLGSWLRSRGALTATLAIWPRGPSISPVKASDLHPPALAVWVAARTTLARAGRKWEDGPYSTSPGRPYP